MAALRVFTDKEALKRALGDLTPDTCAFRDRAWRPVDIAKTYWRNVKCAGPNPLLPGFAPEGLQRDPDFALDRFKHFCLSRFGHNKRFELHFGLITLARFAGEEYGTDYLCFVEGAMVYPREPPCEPEGWGYGVLDSGEEEKGTVVMGWYPPEYVGVGKEAWEAF